MFYLRYYLYKMVKPLIKPLSPEKAIKYHFGALALYVLISSNAAFFAYYLMKKSEKIGHDDDDEPLTQMDKIKRKMDERNSETKKIVSYDFKTGKYETEEFDLAKYRQEVDQKRRKKFEETYKVAMI